MNEPAAELFPVREPAPAQHNTGVLPYQSLRELVRAREIFAVEPIDPEQFQPASLDLRLGHVAYRVRASFLPGVGATVLQKIEQFGMRAPDQRARPPLWLGDRFPLSGAGPTAGQAVQTVPSAALAPDLVGAGYARPSRASSCCGRA